MLSMEKDLTQLYYDLFLFKSLKDMRNTKNGIQLNSRNDKIALTKAELEENLYGANILNLELVVSYDIDFKILDKLNYIYILDSNNYSKITPIFEGRIVSHTKNYKSESYIHYTIVVEGLELLLNDSNTRWGEWFNISNTQFFRSMINEYNVRQPDPNFHFIPRILDEENAFNVNYTVGYNTYWETLQERLVNREKGVISLNKELVNGEFKYYLNYRIKSLPHKLIHLSFGKDIISVHKTTDPNVFSRLYPLGDDIEGSGSTVKAQKVGIHTVNNGIDYIEKPDLVRKYGIIEACIEFKDYKDPTALLRKANETLNNQSITTTWEVEAIDIGYINRYETNFKIGVKYALLDYDGSSIIQDMTLISKRINCLNILKPKLIFGAKYATIDEALNNKY